MPHLLNLNLALPRKRVLMNECGLNSIVNTNRFFSNSFVNQLHQWQQLLLNCVEALYCSIATCEKQKSPLHPHSLPTLYNHLLYIIEQAI